MGAAIATPLLGMIGTIGAAYVTSQAQKFAVQAGMDPQMAQQRFQRHYQELEEGFKKTMDGNFAEKEQELRQQMLTNFASDVQTALNLNDEQAAQKLKAIYKETVQHQKKTRDIARELRNQLRGRMIDEHAVRREAILSSGTSTVHTGTYENTRVAITVFKLNSEQDVLSMQNSFNKYQCLDHNNLVVHIGCGVSRHPTLEFFIVSELVEGESLQVLLQVKKMTFKFDQVASMVVQICEVLIYLEKKGLEFGKFHSSKLILCGDKVVLCGYGNNRLYGGTSTSLTSTSRHQSRSTQVTLQNKTLNVTVKDSNAYEAPEVIHGIKGEKTMVYSIAVFIYEALTGTVPKGKEHSEIERLGPVPDIFKKIISDCLSPNSHERLTLSNLIQVFSTNDNERVKIMYSKFKKSGSFTPQVDIISKSTRNKYYQSS